MDSQWFHTSLIDRLLAAKLYYKENSIRASKFTPKRKDINFKANKSIDSATSHTHVQGRGNHGKKERMRQGERKCKKGFLFL